MKSYWKRFTNKCKAWLLGSLTDSDLYKEEALTKRKCIVYNMKDLLYVRFEDPQDVNSILLGFVADLYPDMPEETKSGLKVIPVGERIRGDHTHARAFAFLEKFHIDYLQSLKYQNQTTLTGASCIWVVPGYPATCFFIDQFSDGTAQLSIHVGNAAETAHRHLPHLLGVISRQAHRIKHERLGRVFITRNSISLKEHVEKHYAPTIRRQGFHVVGGSDSATQKDPTET